MAGGAQIAKCWNTLYGRGTVFKYSMNFMIGHSFANYSPFIIFFSYTGQRDLGDYYSELFPI